MTFRGQGLRSNTKCGLCGNRKKATRSVLAEPCPHCHRTMCANHARYLDDKLVCVGCVPDGREKEALKVAV